MVLFFIDMSTRRVEIGGIARCANGLWMAQFARNLTDAVDGFFTGKRYLALGQPLERRGRFFRGGMLRLAAWEKQWHDNPSSLGPVLILGARSFC